MAQTLLLQGGIVLQHDSKDNVVASTNTDILVKDGRIAQIGTNLPVSPDATVIDCHNKIVSPGFINAHHHMWQSQLKGRLGDCTMLEYIVEGKQPPPPDQPIQHNLTGAQPTSRASTSHPTTSSTPS